eukprot:5477249-Karenia_brevis.AAC.1
MIRVSPPRRVNLTAAFNQAKDRENAAKDTNDDVLSHTDLLHVLAAGPSASGHAQEEIIDTT